MSNLTKSLLAVVLYSSMLYGAASALGDLVNTTSQGATNVTAVFGKDRVAIKIAAHEVDIGNVSDERPPRRLSNCTYSRVPCSVIDNIEVAVNGKALDVPRSVFSDLADIHAASLTHTAGRFILLLKGGDASESYTVKLVFNKRLISQREIISNFNGQVMERSVYFLPSPSIE